MAFGMETAKADTYNRQKLDPGRHVVRVLDLREKVGFKGEGFFMDFEVVSGPTPAGFKAAQKIYPKKARGTDRLTDDEAQARELGKVQRSVAAALGLGADRQGEVTTPRYLRCIARGPNGVSFLAGRLVVVDARPHVNAKKENTVFYEVFPYHGEGQISVEDLIAKAQAHEPQAPSAPAAPAAPPPPVSRPSFEVAMATANYRVHPTSPGWAFKVDAAGAYIDGSMIPLADLQKALGY